jgi:hypothetical protein
MKERLDIGLVEPLEHELNSPEKLVFQDYINATLTLV